MSTHPCQPLSQLSFFSSSSWQWTCLHHPEIRTILWLNTSSEEYKRVLVMMRTSYNTQWLGFNTTEISKHTILQWTQRERHSRSLFPHTGVVSMPSVPDPSGVAAPLFSAPLSRLRGVMGVTGSMMMRLVTGHFPFNTAWQMWSHLWIRILSWGTSMGKEHLLNHVSTDLLPRY